MNETATVIFENRQNGTQAELEIPVYITANELVLALNSVFSLEMDTDNIFHCYLVSENPIAFLRGSKRVSEFGIHNGSRIIFKR